MGALSWGEGPRFVEGKAYFLIDPVSSEECLDFPWLVLGW